MRAPALLCRSVGASSARVRDSETGPNTIAPASSARTAAAAPAPIRRAGSTISQQRPNSDVTAARTRSASGVGSQSTSAGASSFHASTRMRREGGMVSVAPLAKM